MPPCPVALSHALRNVDFDLVHAPHDTGLTQGYPFRELPFVFQALDVRTRPRNTHFVAQLLKRNQ